MKKSRLSLFPGSLKAMNHLKRSDPRFAPVFARVGRMKVELDRKETVFESLAVSIIYQQLHGKAAAAITAKFRALFPKTRRFPGPKAILAMDPARIRTAGLSEAKTAAILDLARKTLAREVPDRRAAEKLTDEELIAAFTKVKGVGPWTAQMLLIFTLGRIDVLPTGDYGVRKGLARLYGLKELPTPKELDSMGAKWAPYRSVAAWYLWRVTELEGFSSNASAASSG
jgi:DNA-3-methyladenine glycosylase II